MFYQIKKHEKHTTKNKTDKNWEENRATYCLGCKDFTHNFRPQDVKMRNKVLREKSNCIVCRSNKSRLLKQKHNNNKKTYCVKCKNSTENLNSKIFKMKKGILIMQSKCPVCRIKKSRFVKEQEAKGLLSNLGIKTPLSKIPLLNVLF